ncbi:MAG: hypothetical protein ACYDBV_02335 [Nitrospiria bacterium]
MQKTILFLSGFICGIAFLIGCGKTEVAQSFAQSVINAIDVVFDNKGTNLNSTNVQNALNEINAKLPNYIKTSDINKLWGSNLVWYGYIRNITSTGIIPFSIMFSNSTPPNIMINNNLYVTDLNIPDDGIISFIGSLASNSLGALINVKLVQRNGINYLTGISLLNDPNTGNVNYNLTHNYFELKECAPGQTTC